MVIQRVIKVSRVLGTLQEQQRTVDIFVLKYSCQTSSHLPKKYLIKATSCLGVRLDRIRTVHTHVPLTLEEGYLNDKQCFTLSTIMSLSWSCRRGLTYYFTNHGIGFLVNVQVERTNQMRSDAFDIVKIRF